MLFVFFFQAEDGIRDVAVTGVQTCALPICADRECTNGRPFGCRWEANWQLLHSQEFLGLGKIQLESRDRRSEEHTSELQSRLHLVCRLLLEKKQMRWQFSAGSS